MINERNSAQNNTPTSPNMQYGYPTNQFDLINVPLMQNPSDLYSFYPPSLYQPFGTYDEHSQWSVPDSSGSGGAPPGPSQFHPQMYTPSALDMPRNPFDYQSMPHAYTQFHPGYNASSFSGPATTAASSFEMPWNPHALSIQQQMQVAAQQQMTPIGGGLPSNKKPSAYDEYRSTGGGVSNMLAQHISGLDLDPHQKNEYMHHYNNDLQDRSQHAGVFSFKEQQQQTYQSHMNNHAPLPQQSQVSSSTGPKSYASVVLSDTAYMNSNKPIPSMSNSSARSQGPMSGNDRSTAESNFGHDSFNSRSHQQPSGPSASGYNPRHQQQSYGNEVQFPSSNNSGPSNTRHQQPPSNNHNNNTTNSRRQPTSSPRIQNNASNSASTTSEKSHEALANLKHSQQYNPKDFNLSPKGARFFVIKSYSEDDVHRSIKYNIWCSTENGNKRLDTAFRERDGKGPVYLFFSVNASGHFCGMAEMMSPIDYDHQTNVWHMSNKWQGKFEVKWIYVKDVPNQQFRNIRLENNENKPVTNSRDTQEIPFEKGKLMLKTMHTYRSQTSIFDDFGYYETKQADEVTTPPKNPDSNHRRAFAPNRTSGKQQSNDQEDDE